MKRQIGLWQLAGFAVTSLLGTLLHFLYDLTGGSALIAPFSGVNESTWEHMKLLFWPLLIFAFIEWLFFRDREEFWCVKLRGTLLGLSLIPLIFYLYNGVIGKSPDWINIAIFFISAAAAYVYETRQFSSGRARCKNPRLAIIMLCVLATMFIVFTFATPTLAIFRDPLTGTFGI